MSCRRLLDNGGECGNPVAKNTPFCLHHGLVARLQVLNALNEKREGKDGTILRGFSHCHQCMEPCGPLELFRCKKHRLTMPSDDECRAYLAELETEGTITSCQYVSPGAGQICTNPALLPTACYCQNHLNYPQVLAPVPIEMRRPPKETKMSIVDIAGDQANFSIKYQDKVYLTNKATVQYNCTFFRDIQESELEIKQDFGSCLDAFLRKLHNPWLLLRFNGTKEMIDTWLLAAYLDCPGAMGSAIKSIAQSAWTPDQAGRIIDIARKLSADQLTSLAGIVTVATEYVLECNDRICRCKFAAQMYQLLRDKKVMDKATLFLNFVTKEIRRGFPDKKVEDFLPVEVMPDILNHIHKL